MKLKSVRFVAPVSFGGTIHSVNVGAPQSVDRPGSQAMEASLVEMGGIPCIRITGMESGTKKVKYTPFSNVSTFELAEEPEKPAKPAK